MPSNPPWSLLVLKALWLALPVVLAGLLQIGIIKANWMRTLAALPIDGGRCLRGRRLFGDNKTVRGAVVMVLACAVAAALQSQAPAPLIRRLSVAAFQIGHPAVWGLLLGAGYILGELPNSLVKRQLGIAPGAAARGWQSTLFWLMDQWDSVCGIFLMLCLVWRPDIRLVVTVFALALLLHTLVAALMVAMGLKQRIG